MTIQKLDGFLKHGETTSLKHIRGIAKWTAAALKELQEFTSSVGVFYNCRSVRQA